jgi:hypothetical protein
MKHLFSLERGDNKLKISMNGLKSRILLGSKRREGV